MKKHAKSINEYLPPPREEMVSVQAKVPVSLHTDVKTLIRARGLSWPKLIAALLRKFVDEQ